MIGIDPVTRRTWRPQDFGTRPARDIDDPLVEPLWSGLRVLAHVESGQATLVDRDGAEVGHANLASVVAEVTLARSAVLDGYLTSDASRPAEGVMFDEPDLPRASGQARRLLLGSRPEPQQQVALRLAGEERAGGLPTDGTLAFVAVDLLELDGDVLLDIPLLERRRLLEAALGEREAVRVGMYVRPPIGGWIRTWRALGFRGLAFKSANGRYRPGMSNDGWSILPMPPR